MRALEVFCMYTKLSINSSKTKIMLVKSQNKGKPCVMCKSWMENFKYFGLKFLHIVDGMNMLSPLRGGNKNILCI